MCNCGNCICVDVSSEGLGVVMLNAITFKICQKLQSRQENGKLVQETKKIQIAVNM